MDFTISKKDLALLVGRTQGIADRRSAMPALANVLLVAEGNTLHASATDISLSMTSSALAEVLQAGSLAVPAKDMYDRVKAMPDGPIHITVSGTQMSLKAVTIPRRYTLHGIPGSEFPTMPQVPSHAASVEIPAESLHKLINRTHFSISADETRAHMNSALFEWVGDKVRMVTTDGHRLTKMELTVEGSNTNATMLLSQKAIGELKRLTEEDELAQAKDTVLKITQHGPNAFFSVGSVVFGAKLVDATFPPYQQAIPAISERSILMSRHTLADALRAIALAATDRTGGVKLFFSKDSLRITSESPESGNAFDEVVIDYTGPEVTVGVNAKYILDIANAVSEEDLTLGVSGELDPVVIRPAKESDKESYVAIVMPMRI